MKINSISIIILLLLTMACTEQTAVVDIIIAEVKEEFAPDKRVATFDIEATAKNGTIILAGETNIPEAKSTFIQQLEGIGLKYEDKIALLPAKDLNGKHYGVVKLSVCNIRSNPKHSGELATQALLGTPLRVWKRTGDWFRVQTPDGYLGWLDEGGFEWMNKAQYEQWMNRPKTVFNESFGFAYRSPDDDGVKVSDLAAGNILAIDSESIGAYTSVLYPDGRKGYVLASELLDYDVWLADNEFLAEHILEDAYQCLGRPYLWGGTSSRAMDCSGFTKTVFYKNGLMLPRDASQQVHVGIEQTYDTTWQNLQPGDLLFFGRKATPEQKERITHVAIHIEDGKMIHASGQVKIESLNRKHSDFNEARFNTFIRAKRMLENIGENGVAYLRDLDTY